MAIKKKILSMKEMEPIARKATHDALIEYDEPSKHILAQWTLGKYETEKEGIFEIYIPAEISIDAKIISCARVDRTTGAVTVEVFLEKKI
jgi:hypothetical protein